MRRPALRAKFRLGLGVLLALMVIEIAEFTLGNSMRSGAWPFLALLAIPGSGLIIYYFMHIAHLWRPKE